MEREVGGGIGMGNTCKPLAVSFQCMTKSTTKKKKNKPNLLRKKKIAKQNHHVSRLLDFWLVYLLACIFIYLTLLQ